MEKVSWICPECNQGYADTPEIIEREKKYHQNHDAELTTGTVTRGTMKAVRAHGKSGESFDTIVARLAGVK